MQADDMNEWSDEMWDIWNNGSGIYHIKNKPYEYGFDEGVELAWIRPKGEDATVVYSNIRRDDPRYVNGTDEFRDMVETVRMVYNLIRAKDVAGKLATE
jgi:hypothetical protein